MCLYYSTSQAQTLDLPTYGQFLKLSQEEVVQAYKGQLDYGAIVRQRPAMDSMPLHQNNPTQYLKSKRHFGYYLYVQYQVNGLNYTLIEVPFAQTQVFQLEKLFRLMLLDSAGLVADYRIKGPKENYSYDTSCRCIYLEKKKLDKGIYVLEKGNQFLVFKQNQVAAYSTAGGGYYRSRFSFRRFFRRFLFWKPKGIGYSQSGFALLNQAEYKHLDSFYAKAYLLDRKGKPYTGEVDVVIQNVQSGHKHFYMKTVAKSYGPGSYGYEWQIPDSLALDQRYQISFQAKKKKVILETEYFKLTHYQLKNYKLDAGQTSKYLYPEDSSYIYLSAVDQNEIPITGTKVTMTYSLYNFGLVHQPKLSLNKAVQTRLYDTTFYLEPQKITYIPVTRSILPNIDAQLTVQINMVTPNNDRKSFHVSFSKADLIEEYKLDEKDRSIVANYYRNERVSKSDTVRIEFVDRYFSESRSFLTTLPYTIENPSRYQNIYIKDTLGRLRASIAPNYHGLNIDAKKKFDTVSFSLNSSESKSLFWELYFKGKRIDQGSSHTYSKAFEGDEPFSLMVFYPEGNQLKAVQKSISAKTGTLQIKPSLEMKSYPGQELRAEYQILDFEGKPVSGANITAFAVNTQMPVLPNPTVPYLAKDKYASLKFKQYNLNGPGFQPVHIQAIDSAHYEQFGLARFVHYRMYFNPKGIEYYHSKSEQGITQFQVRVFEAGSYMLPREIWIDNELAYVRLHAYAQAEPFLIEPGKHKVEIRTEQAMVSLDSIEVKKGEKLSIGLNAFKLLHSNKLNYLKVRAYYEETELDQIDRHLVWFNPGKYYAGSYLKQGNRLFKLSPNTSQHRANSKAPALQYFATGPLKEGIVEFLHPDTNFSFYYRPDQVFTLNKKLEVGNKQNTLFQNHTIRSTQFYFLDEDVLLPDTLLRRWFIQDSLSKLKKDDQVHQAMRTEDPQYNLFTNYNYRYNSQIPKLATLNLQDSGSQRRMNYYWLVSQDSMAYSIYMNADPRTSMSIIPGRYKLFYGNYLKDDYVIDDLVIDTNSLNFVRLDLLKREASKAEKQEASYAYFKTIQEYGHDKPILFDIPRAETESAGQNRKAEVNGWVNQHFKASYNTYVLFVARDGKNKYLAKTNSQGYFSYFDMEPGVYLTEMITPNRQLYFAGTVELKGGRLHSFSFNCVDPEQSNNIAFADRFAEPLSEIKHEYKKSSGTKPLLSLEIKDEKGEPLPFVNVVLLDNQNKSHGGISNDDGICELRDLPSGNYRMVVSYIGFETKTIKGIALKSGQTLSMSIVMKESVAVMNEVMVNEYDGKRYRDSEERSYSYAAPAVKADAALDEVVSFRGTRTAGTAYYVNGTRLEGAVTNIGAELIISRAFEKINGTYKEKDRLNEMRQDEDANRIRDNFKTTAYWFPHLITDREGKIGFSYRNPDDETSWLHYALAIDKKRNTGLNKVYSQSYKPLSAAMKVPEHVIAGDTLYFKPQIRNLTGDTITVSTQFSIDSTSQTDQISLGTYYRTTAYHVFNNADDSSVITYSLDYDGYKDGERRKLPVLSNKTPYRVVKTFLLDRDQNISFNLADSAERRVVRIRSGIVDLIQQEIDDLRQYRYGCTEQTASKLIALIRSKQLKAAIGEPFNEENEIVMLIDRLEDFQSRSGGFGWYKNSRYDLNLTLYAAQALNLAAEAGYSTKAHRRAAGVMINSLKSLTAEQTLAVLVLASKLDMKYDYNAEIQKFDRYNLPLQAEMTLMELKQLHKRKPDLKVILNALKQDANGFIYLDGNSKWGFNSQVLDLTLQAYRIMKTAGGYGDKLAGMRKFVFANLKNSNHNTFEKANIINTLVEEAKEANTALFKVQVGNQNYVKQVSLQAQGGELNVRNAGEQVSIIVVEEYPDLNGRMQASGMALESKLLNSSGQVVQQAQAGEIYRLRVTVNSSQTRKYVLTQIPLPSGFIVLEKPERLSDESGREYYPDHIRIYHEVFSKGYHTYEFVLLPQFSGNFQLLPSRAEDMYDPSFYGCSTKARIEVKE